jgi:hypothetical protein
MSQHTQTPWRVKKVDKYHAVYSDDVPLALVLSKYVSDKHVAESNAILMANAPLLLKALKKVMEHLENSMVVTREGFKINDGELRALVADAIAKAEGYRGYRG